MNDNENNYDVLEFDYFTPFIKKTITELKSFGLCYVFSKTQVEEVKKQMPNVTITENECGYTLELEKVA